MRRLLVALACVVALALVACDGDEPPPPRASPSATASESPTASPSPSASRSPSPSPSPSPSATPTPEPILDVPADAPVAVDDPESITRINAGDFSPLAPAGAEILASVADRERLLITWIRGEAFAGEHGLSVWMPGDVNEWRAVYAITDPPRTGVLGIGWDDADLTRDGTSDIVTREDFGGSGACARWRVVAFDGGGPEVLWQRKGCDAEVTPVGDELEVREAVFEPDDAHCCPSAFRTTTLRWDGERFVETDVVEVPTGN